MSDGESARVRRVRAAVDAIIAIQNRERRAQELTALQAVLQELAPSTAELRRQDLEWLRDQQDLSHAEIGALIGVSAARVTQLLRSPTPE